MSEQMLSNRDWVELVKATRQKFGVSIDEAHRLILQDATMRRLVALRINRDQECRKTALSDWRRNGDRSLVEWEGKSLRLRQQS